MLCITLPYTRTPLSNLPCGVDDRPIACGGKSPQQSYWRSWSYSQVFLLINRKVWFLK